jgi:predicted lipoprotein with Yx(FWY)xxD motif
MVGGGNRGSGVSAIKVDPMPEGWKPALLFPFENVQLPPGLAVKEVPDAAAFSLVDHRGHTLYALDDKSGKLQCPTQACKQWRPVNAPQLIESVGDFSTVDRVDGVRQWVYKGKPLYTFERDLAPGYANGVNVDKRWSVAAIARYYMPAGVSIHTTPGQGSVLATAEGKTLYRRDGYIFQSGGGHSLRRGQPARPAVGRDIGTNPRCGADCEKEWRAFTAPADAQPRGFWDVAVRSDGSKQWVYQGYALWTYVGDKQSGDMNGHDAMDIILSDDPNTIVDVGTPMDGGASLIWAIALP